ncbi:hypothetical protein CEXT_739621 [Caerostris extrusa]|uniref:Uncharacterized protein n=1 Tax=Caerostris extrusa TaxID=172846 RepID=A0AAV4VXY0_CAEEX|nr:hypothetical protein CEXT_739621 [Caerostris extrusa]
MKVDHEIQMNFQNNQRTVCSDSHSENANQRDPDKTPFITLVPVAGASFPTSIPCLPKMIMLFDTNDEKHLLFHNPFEMKYLQNAELRNQFDEYNFLKIFGV